jgi:transposase
MGRMTLITGGERRRQWSQEERARILTEIFEPGAVVSEVARRSDVCTSLVYKWRREALRRETASGFAPVVIEPAPAILASPTAAKLEDAAAIVVEVRDARVRIGAAASSALIAATLKALRA